MPIHFQTPGSSGVSVTGTSAPDEVLQRGQGNHRLAKGHVEERGQPDLALRRIAQDLQRSAFDWRGRTLSLGRREGFFDSLAGARRGQRLRGQTKAHFIRGLDG